MLFKKNVVNHFSLRVWGCCRSSYEKTGLYICIIGIWKNKQLIWQNPLCDWYYLNEHTFLSKVNQKKYIRMVAMNAKWTTTHPHIHIACITLHNSNVCMFRINDKTRWYCCERCYFVLLEFYSAVYWRNARASCVIVLFNYN